MGKVKSWSLLFAPLRWWVGIAAFLVLNTGYSISEMDWDSDGKTSLTEMMRAVDVGRRLVKKDEIECQEFYSLKDGLPIRVDCPKPK